MDVTREITASEYNRYFAKALKDAVELGVYPLRTQMLPTLVRDVIFQICDEYPTEKPDLVKKARQLMSDHLAWLAAV